MPTTISIARTCHEVNRAYCIGLGDDSQLPWDDAPRWQQDSAIAGVEAVIDGTASTSEEQHRRWMEQKIADGWQWGLVKDAETKTHPCLVPYSELPPSQSAKDELFRAVVKGMLGRLVRCEEPR